MIQKKVFVQSLLAMREQINLMLEILGAEGEPEACQHPLEARIDMSTMGHIKWQCRPCGYVHEEKV